MPELSIEDRAQWAGPTGLTPEDWRRVYPRRHQYGPPIPPDPWPTVTVGHPKSYRDPEREIPAPESLIRQRRAINALAYLEVVED